jgi:hypothetical protein
VWTIGGCLQLVLKIRASLDVSGCTFLSRFLFVVFVVSLVLGVLSPPFVSCLSLLGMLL